MEKKVMNDIKRALLQKYKEIYNCGYIPLFFEKQLQNAKSIICQGKYSSEDIITIYDTSITGNGKSGMILTVDAVCVKDTLTKFIIKYEDITDISVTKSRFLRNLFHDIKIKTKYKTEHKYSTSMGRVDKRAVELILCKIFV